MVELMSDRTEEYLEALYTLTQNGQTAGTSHISRRLNIAPASVTEMLKKLAETGYVNYSPYQGATLTPRGYALAEKMTRKHRLLERFLHDILHIGKDRVHNEACAMEHSLSDETERAMCQTLKIPVRCPDDNNVIPPCHLGFKSCAECGEWKGTSLDGAGSRPTNIIPLSGMKEKQAATVRFIRGNNKLLRRLLDLGLTPGTKITIERVAPLKGPIEISVRGSRLALGEEVVCNVFVDRPGEVASVG